MKNLKEFLYHKLVNESEQLHGWYSDWYNDKFEMQGDILPPDLSDILANGISVYPLERNKKIDVYIALKNNIYEILISNVKEVDIYAQKSSKGIINLINSNLRLSFTENCKLHIVSAGISSPKTSWRDIDDPSIRYILDYFKQSNPKNHFSRVEFECFQCNNCALKYIEDYIPSESIYLYNCANLTKLNYKLSRNDLKISCDKSTINGKLKLDGLLDNSNPTIKTVIRKSEITKKEQEAERIELERKLEWKTKFDVKKFAKTIRAELNYTYEIQSIGVIIPEDVHDNFLLIDVELDGTKSYGDMQYVSKSVAYIYNDNLNTYKATTSIPVGYSFSEAFEIVEDWVLKEIKQYDNLPPKIIIKCGRMLVG